MGPTPDRIPHHAARFGWPLPPLAGAQDPPAPPAPVTPPAPAPQAPAQPATPPAPAAPAQPPAVPTQLQPPNYNEGNPDWFPRDYVESLRRESAGYRERAQAAEGTQQQTREEIRDLVAQVHGVPGLASFITATTREEMVAQAQQLAGAPGAQPPAPPTPPVDPAQPPTAPTVPQTPTPPPENPAVPPVTPPPAAPPVAPTPLPIPPRGAAPMPPNTEITAEQARHLAKTDPDKFNELFDAGQIPASALTAN